MTDKTISAEQVAILAERVDVANQNHAELRGLIVGIANSQGTMATQIAVMSEKLVQQGTNERRLFELSDEHSRRLDSHSGAIRVHTWTWRLVGGLSTLAFALGAYVFTQFDALKTTDSSHNNRLTLLEFIVGGRANYQQQQQQNIEAPK